MAEIFHTSGAAGIGTIVGAMLSFLGFRGRFTDLKQRVDGIEKNVVLKDTFNESKERTAERDLELSRRLDGLSLEIKEVAKNVKNIEKLLIKLKGEKKHK